MQPAPPRREKKCGFSSRPRSAPAREWMGGRPLGKDAAPSVTPRVLRRDRQLSGQPGGAVQRERDREVSPAGAFCACPALCVQAWGSEAPRPVVLSQLVPLGGSAPFCLPVIYTPARQQGRAFPRGDTAGGGGTPASLARSKTSLDGGQPCAGSGNKTGAGRQGWGKRKGSFLGSRMKPFPPSFAFSFPQFYVKPGVTTSNRQRAPVCVWSKAVGGESSTEWGSASAAPHTHTPIKPRRWQAFSGCPFIIFFSKKNIYQEQTLRARS